MRRLVLLASLLGLPLMGGCPQTGAPVARNPFLTATEAFGSALSGDTDGATGGGGGAAVEGVFRQPLELILANGHPTLETSVQFVAWVRPSSIRNADQQDDLIRDGYVQLNREIQIGDVFTLPPGTFVYNGPGTAGATFVRIPPTGNEELISAATAVQRSFSLLTPDAILVFLEPPTSCDSVGFAFTDDGFAADDEDLGSAINLIISGATVSGNLKTLSQVQGYRCSPLQPGFFLNSGAGGRQENEFNEGDAIRIDFSPVGDEFANFAWVAIAPEATSALPTIMLGEGDDDGTGDDDTDDDTDGDGDDDGGDPDEP